jgi:hypothetical protein
MGQRRVQPLSKQLREREMGRSRNLALLAAAGTEERALRATKEEIGQPKNKDDKKGLT